MSASPVLRAPEPRPPASPAAPTAPFQLPAVGLLTALPDFALAGVFLVAWVAPGTLHQPILGYLVLTMLLEFIIMHSSAFMGVTMFRGGDPGARARGLLGLGAVYTIFVAGFALIFKTWWPFLSFWCLTVNRMMGVLLGQAPAGEELLFVRRSWAASALFYLGFAMPTILLPLPRLGLTADYVAAQHLPSSGLWIEEPHRAVAFGFLYFTATAISEIFGHRWVKENALPKMDKAA